MPMNRQKFYDFCILEAALEAKNAYEQADVFTIFAFQKPSWKQKMPMNPQKFYDVCIPEAVLKAKNAYETAEI